MDRHEHAERPEPGSGHNPAAAAACRVVSDLSATASVSPSPPTMIHASCLSGPVEPLAPVHGPEQEARLQEAEGPSEAVPEQGKTAEEAAEAASVRSLRRLTGRPCMRTDQCVSSRVGGSAWMRWSSPRCTSACMVDGTSAHTRQAPPDGCRHQATTSCGSANPLMQRAMGRKGDENDRQNAAITVDWPIECSALYWPS